MNSRIKYILIFLTLLCINVNLSAQEFKATVDKTTVGQYERFRVYFTFEDVNANNVRNFRGPDFKGFQILSGPNQSTSMQIINGAVSGSISYNYIVQASDIGEFTIGSASADYDGKSFTTNPIKLNVVKGTGTPNQPDNNGGVSQEELAKNVFILAVSDKQNVMQGEQITVTYKLYVKTNINSPQISKLPTYKGFWAEDIETSQNIRFDIEMYRGERYRSAVIKKVALFPTQSGELSVTPFELTVPVIIRKRRDSGSVFDDFFNDSFFGRSEAVDYNVKSNSIKINVQPLPANAPQSFKGAVGNFTLDAAIDKKEVEQNESINIIVNISGTGNIKLLDVPKLEVPVGFESYEPKISDNINRTAKVSGSKKVEYLLVPRVSGAKTIPGLEFTYFDVVKRKYSTLSTPAFVVNVKKGKNTYDNASSGFSKEDVRLLSQDIRYIKISSFNLQKRDEFSLISKWFWFGIIFPVLFLSAVLMIKKRQDKLSGNTRLMKYNKAEKAARNRLKSAKKSLDAGNNEQFYNEISQAMSGYLEDKLDLQKSDFTLDRAVSKLYERNVDIELIDQVKVISEKCEFARFAPNHESGAAEKELYDKSMDVIINLENSITAKKKKK
ncbi:MAG: BatD family protein [Bacteroidetes bacterium]|nr:BatD family protein [Bacteroidota bacterium]